MDSCASAASKHDGSEHQLTSAWSPSPGGCYTAKLGHFGWEGQAYLVYVPCRCNTAVYSNPRTGWAGEAARVVPVRGWLCDTAAGHEENSGHTAAPPKALCSLCCWRRGPATARQKQSHTDLVTFSYKLPKPAS